MEVIESFYHGKLFLCGEWSALLPGAKSLILSIPKQLKTEFIISENAKLIVECISGNYSESFEISKSGIHSQQKAKFSRALIELCQANDLKFKDSFPRGTLKLISNSDPQKWGFGTSALAPTALLKELNFSDQDVFEILLKKSRTKTFSSGADLASALFQRSFIYETPENNSKNFKKLCKNLFLPEKFPFYKILKPPGKPQRTEKKVKRFTQRDNWHALLQPLFGLNQNYINSLSEYSREEHFDKLKEIQDFLQQNFEVPTVVRDFNKNWQKNHCFLKSCGACGHDAHILFGLNKASLDRQLLILRKAGFKVFEENSTF